MSEDSARPQDVGRRHARRGAVGPETRALLDRYQASMRSELGVLLDSLEPVPQDQGLGMVTVPPKRPDLATRSRTWDLAMKLGRELGTAIDPTPSEGAPAAPRPRRPRKVDYG